MCGICGILNTKNDHYYDMDLLIRMVNAQSHRGPDETNYFLQENLSLGFNRLSIIGLDNGSQPILNEDGSIVLVCNGEIFNYKELKKELLTKGHYFKTDTDVEVIIHLYEEHGIALLDLLEGQFAFALYDFRSQSLYCARDHLGIIPFFYTMIDGAFLFSSEIKSLLECGRVQRNLDLTSLDMVMTFPGITSPRTMFQNISSLSNGHYMKILKDGSIELHEYWDLVFPMIGDETKQRSEESYAEELYYLLEGAVHQRMQSDVGVGFYLSGGLDSSLITALGNLQKPSEMLQTYSIDFPHQHMTEKKYQKIMQSVINSQHHEILVTDNDIVAQMRNVIFHSECMLKESYNAASLLLAKKVNQTGVKVILTGEGADELFAGYIGYKFDHMRNRFDDEDENYIRQKLWGNPNFFYEKDYGNFTRTKQQLYSEAIRCQFAEIDCLKSRIINKQRIRNRDMINQRSYIDYKLRLPDHLLADHGDRMSMANSVECRYPFLDRKVVEFAANLPPDLKLKNYNEKFLLKKVANGLVPASIVKRTKFSFVAPGSSNLIRQNNEYINYIISDEYIRKKSFFDVSYVNKLKKRYKEDGFKLNLPFESDLLITVISLGIFADVFNITSL